MENMEQLRELISKKRRSKNLAREKVSELLKIEGIEYAESSLTRFENGKIKNIRIEILNALCDILDIDKKEAFSLAGLDNKNILCENEGIIMNNKKEIILKVYNFDSSRDGLLSFNDYIEMSQVVDTNEVKEFKNNISVNISGNLMQPFFFEGDKILIKKEELTIWGDLNRKIVLYKLEDKFYLRKVLFIDGKGYLEAFNKDVYGKFEIDYKVKYIGRVVKQFNTRDLSNIEF